MYEVYADAFPFSFKLFVVARFTEPEFLPHGEGQIFKIYLILNYPSSLLLLVSLWIN